MEKQCAVCGGDGKYKCPTCLVYYCCVGCCQAHRRTGCVVATDRAGSSEKRPGATAADVAEVKYPTADTVFPEKLRKLKDDKTIGDLLCNPHLRKYLVEINESSKPDEMMQKAMQEPIFVEFGQQCIRIVESAEPKNS